MKKLINADGTRIEVPDERAEELKALGWTDAPPDEPAPKTSSEDE